MHALFLGFLSYSIDYIFTFVPVPYCFNDCSFVVKFEVKKPDSSISVFLSQDCLAIQGLLCFNKNLEIFFFFCSKCYW